MRLQSEKKITVRGKVIGGPDPLVCLPLVSKVKSDLVDQAAELKKLDPDLFEWRIDAYDQVEDVKACLDGLKALRAVIANTPLIFTCRIDREGGFKPIDQETRLKLIEEAVQTGDLDLVDIEMCNEPEFIEKVKKTTRAHGARLILSYHNFEGTPEEGFIHDKLVQAQEMGADISKVAVMPSNYGDVLKLLSATYKARTRTVKVPIVTMAMALEGVLTRLAGGLFGSDITFAIGKESSAPGQIPIGDLRQAMKVLY